MGGLTDQQRELLDAVLAKHNIPVVDERAYLPVFDEAGATVPLSPREIEVLTMVADGCTNDEIAAHLFVTSETVKSHVRHLLPKMRVRNRTQAAAEGIRRGLIE